MPPIDVGVAMATMTGQVSSADRHLVMRRKSDVLLAVMDGVGHGVMAEQAAVEATRTLSEAEVRSLESLIERCHERLRATRGVVMSVASLDRNGQLTWLGVGNVAGVVFRNRGGGSHATEWLILRGGVVGHRLPPLQGVTVQLEYGDTLVFATDGVASDFDQDQAPAANAQLLADRILRRHAKGNDDAVVLVVRWLGVDP